jgi:hypothetical protein
MADLPAVTAQAIAEAANLKAAGVSSGPQTAPVRAQVTPGMAPGEATRISAQNMVANTNTPPQQGAKHDLKAELAQFASSPHGQALAQVQGPSPAQQRQQEPPGRAATSAPAASSTDALKAELAKFGSGAQQGPQHAPAPDLQPKR